MQFSRLWIHGCCCVGILALVMTLAPAQQGGRGRGKSGKALNEIVQTFPSNGIAESGWKIRWREESGPGLIIQDAYFKRNPQDPWIQVLGEARLSEAFVPYHRGSPRFWDVSYNFPLCTVTQADAGKFGKLLSSAPGKNPTVVSELKDYGIAWKDSAGVRRGEALVLWGTLSAANYRYIIEYTFRDDGLIRFNVGATGHNYPGSEWEPHMHNHLWRIDVNLDDAQHNSVQLCEHLEPDPQKKKSQATTIHEPFNKGKEGFADFDANKFTMLNIYSTKTKNARDYPWSYDLVPFRMGNSRHYGSAKESCTHHDFWVTKNRPGEIYITKINDYIKDPENKQEAEDINDTDVVIWYSCPGHHEPRSEDGEMKKGRNGRRSFTGATPVMWTFFELKPRDFWDRTPYFPAND